MQQDFSEIHDTPHLPNDVPNEGTRFSEAAKGKQQAGKGKPPARESAELAASLGPGQEEDALLRVETFILQDTDEDEAVFLEGPSTGVDTALPWYRTRWFYISAGVVATALTSAGTILLIQGLRRRKHQRFLVGQVKTALRPASSRAQSRLNQFTGQLGEQTSKRVRQFQKQLVRLSRQTQQAPGRMKIMQRQASAAIAPKHTRGQLKKSSQLAGRQLEAFGDKARITTARAASQVQHSLSSVSTGVSSGVARTGKSFQHTWKLGRALAIGIGSGAIWASLFTPQSGEETRTHLAETVQRLGKKSE
jgi:hypothetical protein